MYLKSSDKFLLKYPENRAQTKQQKPREAENTLAYKLWGLHLILYGWSYTLHIRGCVHYLPGQETGMKDVNQDWPGKTGIECHLIRSSLWP